MKTFFIFKEDEQGNPAMFVTEVSGSVTDARDVLKGVGFDAGKYRIVEDTSGTLKKSVVTRQDVALEFDVPEARKRPRKARKAPVTEHAGQQKRGAQA